MATYDTQLKAKGGRREKGAHSRGVGAPTFIVVIAFVAILFCGVPYFRNILSASIMYGFFLKTSRRVTLRFDRSYGSDASIEAYC